MIIEHHSQQPLVGDEGAQHPVRARAGVAVKAALFIAVPILIGAATRAMSIQPLGMLSNLVRAEISTGRSAGANLRAVEQAIKAPADGSVVRRALDQAKWVAGDFLSQVAPAELAPDKVEFDVGFVDPPSSTHQCAARFRVWAAIG